MKLIKPLLLSSTLFLLLFKKDTSNYCYTISNFSNQSGSLFGEKKTQSYKIKIDLVDENYTQTYNLNESELQINVKVYGKPVYFSCSNLSQITCNYKAIIDSDEKILTGKIDFQATMTTIGNKEKSTVEKEYKDLIIGKIIKAIE